MSLSRTPCPGCGGALSHGAHLCRACRYPEVDSDDAPFPENGPRRARSGCVCTFENAAGKTLTVHRGGPPLKGLAEACDIALGHDETFRLVSYSNPTTVYQDLQGHRLGASRSSELLTPSDRPTLPESTVLAQIGRRELLHPRLCA